jgi:hypothetical protein
MRDPDLADVAEALPRRLEARVEADVVEAE